MNLRQYCGAACLAAGLLATAARAQEASPPAAAPAPVPPPDTRLRVAQETAAVTLRDTGKTPVTLRVPLALHRPANVFRLYGPRPLTLQNRDRRRDLYRDALLELATRARLSPKVTAWDSVFRQLQWLGPRNLAIPPRALPEAVAETDLVKTATGMARQLAAQPGYRHLQVLTRLLGESQLLTGDGRPPLIAEPVVATLQLRALATDEAERRLALLGEILHPEAPGADPALRDGYRAARAEFDSVRQGLWPAVAAAVQKNQGRLVLAAVRQIALSNLGFWAIFGYLGFQGVESVLNTEYHGQYAICLATLACALAEAGPTADRGPRTVDSGPPSADPNTQPPTPNTSLNPDLALYAEYALDYELTEALRAGQVMELKPAGGRTAESWQVVLGLRCAELKKQLAP